LSDTDEVKIRSILLKYYSSECLNHATYVLTLILILLGLVEVFLKVTNQLVRTFVFSIGLTVLSIFVPYVILRLMWWGYLASAVVSYVPEDSLKNRNLKTLHEECVDCIRGTGEWQGKPAPLTRRLASKVASGPLGMAILSWFFITVIILLIVNYNYYLIRYL